IPSAGAPDPPRHRRTPRRRNGDGRRGHEWLRRVEARDLQAPEGAGGNGRRHARGRRPGPPAVAAAGRDERSGRLDGSSTGCLGAPVRRCRRVPQGVPMNTPPIVSPQDWEAAREQLLVKEKEITRARDALAAERRRMPWTKVEKDYRFEGPD